MLDAKRIFLRNIEKASEIGALYDHLSGLIPIREQFDDLLRAQLVNSVSAFDKLIHDLVRIGMVQIFEGLRPTTSKYSNESLAIQHLPGLTVGAIPPPAIRFEELVREKLSVLSFQDPNKVADGLSYIWNEKQKWQKIARGLGMSDDVVKRKLRLIVTRRNAIVHEADLDPVNHQKQAITRREASETTAFLLALGNRVCDLII